MPLLHRFWHAAATLSGRVDLSNALLQHSGELARLDIEQLQRLGISARHAKRWRDAIPLPTSIEFLTLDDPAYPAMLAPIPFSPPVLFHQGNTRLLSEGPRVAIVGARRCTEDGRRMAKDLARRVVAGGGVVVSGMAHGIDTAAHLAAPGRTIAVLGQGLAAPRTQIARRISTKIIQAGGLIVSEFIPPRTASKHTFPQRNRVIAGLSQLTVVVEASIRSGAMITARLALEAGRDVAAVPGSPYAPSSAGCLKLLHQGAALIRDADDLAALVHLPSISHRQPTTHTDDPVLRAIHPLGSRFS